MANHTAGQQVIAPSWYTGSPLEGSWYVKTVQETEDRYELCRTDPALPGAVPTTFVTISVVDGQFS